MNKTMSEKSGRRNSARFDWMIELAVFASITPAVIYGVLSLNNLPVIA